MADVNLELSQSLRQTQQMLITAQMIQSVEILQLQRMELRERINQELEENPALEIQDNPDEIPIPGTPEEKREQEDESAASSNEEEHLDPASSDEVAEQFDDFDSHLDDYVKDDYIPRKAASSSDDDEDEKSGALSNTPTRAPSLQDYLSEQLSFMDLPLRQLEMCRNIVFNLSDDGYLHSREQSNITLEETGDALAEILDTVKQEDPENDWTREELDEALDIVQELEPPGVAARSLKECLLLQLLAMPDRRPFEETLIRDYLDDVVHNRFPKIARDLSCDLDKIKEGVAFISSLHPRPGFGYGGETSKYVVPDVIMEFRNGEYFIRLAQGDLPQLRVSETYRSILENDSCDPETKKYIKQKIKSAHWLLQALEQRNRTLLKTAESLVKFQREFFDAGESQLKPLMMQQVADDIGMHISTVSRTVANKYLQSPQGIHEMRFFFTGGYQRDDGSVESDRVIQQRLRELVETEDGKSPKSDEEISLEFQQKFGIKIARRTIAKYRHKIGIPSTRNRRKY